MREPFILFKKIREARIQAGLSQKELGEKIGVSDKTVSAYETGRAIPPLDVLTKIVKITGMPLNHVLGISERESQEDLGKKLERLDKRLSRIERMLARGIKNE